MMTIMNTNNDVSLVCESNEWTEALPAKNREDLSKFNEALADDTKMASVCSIFSVVGGRDIKDSVRRLLSKLLTNNLALLYNWSGQHEKHQFGALVNIINLITAVVRKNPMCKNATRENVESVVKVWLRNAGDRDGGRNRRRHHL